MGIFKSKLKKSETEQKSKVEMVTESNGDCGVCYFPLSQFKVGVLRFHSKRACPHYFHVECVTEHTSCCICKSRCNEVRGLPIITEEPRLWFQLCDLNLKGKMKAKDIVNGLVSCLDVDRVKIEAFMNDLWPWDKQEEASANEDTTMSMNFFCYELIPKLISQYSVLKKEAMAELVIPHIDRDPQAWFDFWDADSSGFLEKEEMIRAMIKTYCTSANNISLIIQAKEMRVISETLWGEIYGDAKTNITFQEFSQPFGLAEQIYRNYLQSHFMTEEVKEIKDDEY
jgi:hypothetical protein